MGSGAWASHDCCGHPADSGQAADSESGTSSPDGDCICACCQADTAIFPSPAITFQFDPRWSVVIAENFAVSRAGTAIFRPPEA